MEYFRHPRSGFDRWFRFLERRRSSDRFVINTLLFAAIAALLFFAITVSGLFMNETPLRGGTITEGIVGTPRFVNPVLATTRADQDISALVYRGLMRIDDSGVIVPDVAERVEVSEEGRVYYVKLREDITFHDGEPLQARDVLYTIGLIQNLDLKSPLRSSWFGVTVEEIGDFELNIVLEEAYPPFVENLTVGILPHHLWGELPIEQLPFSQNNTEPIGAGPFRVSKISYNQSGLIETYTLTAFNNHDPEPRLDSVVLRFFPDEGSLFTALDAGEITSTPSLTESQLASVNTNRFTIHEAPLPRTFALFFNQNRSPVLRDSAAREALSVAIDRQELVNKVLFGYGLPTNSPIPPGFGPVGTSSIPVASSTRLERASNILRDGGWVKNESGIWEKEIDEETVPFALTITTANLPMFEATATYVAETWKTLGVDVSTAQYAQGDLVQAIIRPRDFQVLLFGTDVGRQLDLYSFWHSSQREDPGLNIAQYTNITADSLLNTIRTTKDDSEKNDSLLELADTITADHPAVFLYIPTFTYVTDSELNLSPFTEISKPSDRFMNISSWHINTGSLWPLFTNTEN